MPNTKDETMRLVTDEYLSGINPSNPPSPKDLQQQLLGEVRTEFKLHNAAVDKEDRWRLPEALSTSQIAAIMLRLYNIKNIACAGENADTAHDLLAIYQPDGYNQGIYVTDENIFQDIMSKYSYNITKKDMDEVMHKIKIQAERVKRCENRDLIAVNNGIFDYETKTLMSFDPNLVFIAKSHVNYNPNAKNITIHNPDDDSDWNIEDWMKELSDDPEIVQVLWEILGAIIRPHVRWNKVVCFYSEQGNNGKGTLCQLLRNICGDNRCAAIPFDKFGHEFMLSQEPLPSLSMRTMSEPSLIKPRTSRLLSRMTSLPSIESLKHL